MFPFSMLNSKLQANNMLSSDYQVSSWVQQIVFQITRVFISTSTKNKQKTVYEKRVEKFFNRCQCTREISFMLILHPGLTCITQYSISNPLQTILRSAFSNKLKNQTQKSWKVIKLGAQNATQWEINTVDLTMYRTRSTLSQLCLLRSLLSDPFFSTKQLPDLKHNTQKK